MANQTDPYKLFPESHVVTTMKFVCVFFTIIGNGLVILVVATDKLVRRVPYAHFICSLAAAHFLVGAVLMTTDTVMSILRQYGPDGTFISVFMFRARFALFTASIWTLCFISYDRYFFVTRHREYSSWMSQRRKYLFASAGWLFAFFLTSIFQCESHFPKDVKRISVMIRHVLAFHLPILAISIMYVRIVHSLRKASSISNTGETDPQYRAKSSRCCQNMSSNTLERILLLSLLVAFVYLLWVPPLAYYFFILIKGGEGDLNIWHVTDWMRYGYSLVYPFIYAVASSKLRSTIISLVKCDCCRKTQDSSTRMLTSVVAATPALTQPRRPTLTSALLVMRGSLEENDRKGSIQSSDL